CWSRRWPSARSRLLPEVDRLATPAQPLTARLQVALERGLAAVVAARHVVERRGEMEGPHVGLDAQHLPAAVEQHERRRVGDAQRTRPGGPAIAPFVQREAVDRESLCELAHAVPP